MPMISLADLQRRIDSGALSADAAIAQSFEGTGAQAKPCAVFVCHAGSARAATAGPLRGIAVGIKDIMDTADFPTEMGSAASNRMDARADPPVVAMLKATTA